MPKGAKEASSPPLSSKLPPDLQAEELLLTIELGVKGIRHPVHGHSYTRFTAFRPHACKACGTTIWGVFAPACTCLNCGILVHRRCALRITIIPCGSYRGLHDPDGCLSPGRRSPSPVPPIGSPANSNGGRSTSRSTSPFSSPAVFKGRFLSSPIRRVPSPVPPSKGGTTPSSSPGLRMFGEATTAATDAAGRRLSASPTTPPDSSGDTTNMSPQKRSPYEAFTILPAVVGGILGGFAGGPAGTLMAAKIGQATTIASSTFKVSGILAGAYVGYNKTISHMPEGNDAWASVWSGLAASVKREFATSPATTAAARTPANKPGVGDKEGEPLEVMSRLLDDRGTLPGRLWRRCRARFRMIHGLYDSKHVEGSASVVGGGGGGDGKVGGRDPAAVDVAAAGREDSEGQEDLMMEMMKGGHGGGGGSGIGSPVVVGVHGTAVEDSRAIMHELILAMLECHPPWRGDKAAIERAMAITEALVMEGLYNTIFAEVSLGTAQLDRALEAWLMQPTEEMLQGDEEALKDKRVVACAQGIVNVTTERTGLGKLGAVTRAVTALGTGAMCLTPDELLPLLVLSVRRAAVPLLHAELAFIEEFSDVRQLLGAEGYAFTSLQAALQTIVPPLRPVSVSPPPLPPVDAGGENV